MEMRETERFIATTKFVDHRKAEIDRLRYEIEQLRTEILQLNRESANFRDECERLKAEEKQVRAALLDASEELERIRRSRGYWLLRLLYRIRDRILLRSPAIDQLAGTPVKEAAGELQAGGRSPPDAAAEATTVDAAAKAEPAEHTSACVPYSEPPIFTRRCAIVVLPIIDWEFRFQRPQQLARAFSRRGHRVFYLRTAFRGAPEVVDIEPGVTGIALAGPIAMNLYRDAMPEGVASDLADQLGAELKRQGVGATAIVTQLPFWTPLARRLREILAPAALVYDCMDDHAGFSTNAPAMLASEGELLSSSDLVTVSSKRLFDRVADRSRTAVLIRNAASPADFVVVASPSDGTGNARTIGYFGAIADWFDAEIVGALARLRPDWRFELIGSTHTADTSPLLSLSNLKLRGERSYKELPAMIAGWDACIIPFKRNSLTDATDPVKLYEMLAAGKPVVSVHLPELEALASEGLVRFASTAEEFSRELEAALETNSDEEKARRRSYALANTWEHRVAAFEQAIAAAFPLVSIIVVTYNNRDLNELCLASLLGDTDYPNIEIIVVDNASNDGTREYLNETAQRESNVRLILNQTNRGFAAANNQGVAAASGDYICLLNNDTVVSGPWLSALVRHMRADRSLGLIGPLTNSIGNAAKIEVGYSYLTDLPVWTDAVHRERRGELADIDSLAFFCVLTRREVWERVGPLDERFAHGMFEDDDWNRRVRLAGYQVKLARDSFVHHWHSASLKKLRTRAYQQLYFDNRRRFRIKWGEISAPPPAAGSVLQPLLQAADAVEFCVFFPRLDAGTPDSVVQRRDAVARAFTQLGAVVIRELAYREEPQAWLTQSTDLEFEYSGRRDCLEGFNRLIVWSDCSNLDARDEMPPGSIVVFDFCESFKRYAINWTRTEWLLWRGVREAEVFISAEWSLRLQIGEHRDRVLYLPSPRPATQRARGAPVTEADAAWKSRLLDASRPVAGYLGPVNNQLDFDLLAAVAAQCPDWNFVLLGLDTDGSIWTSGLTRLPNVLWVGSYGDRLGSDGIPCFDVAMLPFVDRPLGPELPSPAFDDYLAAGIPVLASPHAQLQHALGIDFADGAKSFARALSVAFKRKRDPLQFGAIERIPDDVVWRAHAERVLKEVSAIDPAAG